MGTAKNSMVYIGDNSAKLAPTQAKGMTLTFDYIDDEWIFSVHGITDYINQVVNHNKRQVRLQIVKVLSGSKTTNRAKYRDMRKGQVTSKEKAKCFLGKYGHNRPI